MKTDTPGLMARFTYTPIFSGNRRATGSHWRGHKLFALISVRDGASIWKATNHEECKYVRSVYSELASRICRANGDVMDNKWFFNRSGVSYYVIDRDVSHVEVASVKVRKIRM